MGTEWSLRNVKYQTIASLTTDPIGEASAEGFDKIKESCAFNLSFLGDTCMLGGVNFLSRLSHM